MLAEYEAAGILRREPVPWLRLPEAPAGDLAFPGKVLADAAGERLFIADTSYNRIVVADLDGQVRQVYGLGEAGLQDGTPGMARFNHPQGLTLDDGMLYVADTENHAIRRIDLATGITTTIAGTGRQAQRYTSGGPPRETDLTSPWDLVVVDGVLYIAMAGNHQLWMHRVGGDEVRRFAGSGHEGLRDGPTAGAHLAQPSGITRNGLRHALLFTDSETSSVRTADLPGHGAGMVTTLVGHGLFEFGDIDGGYDEARLQHPLGIAFDPDGGLIYVADTYNSTIKRLDPATGIISSWIGGDGALNEPAGISIAGGALYIADTNNHAIRRADLRTGDVTTIEIRGL
jgi:sugar lactone lactonase YvrE